MGSARASRAGDRALAIANFCWRKDFGEAPKSARQGACATRSCPMTPTLQLFLIISAALFCIGLLAALSRRHAIFILIGIEMMIAAAGLNFIAFWRFGPPSQQPTGVMVAIFAIAIAAAEAAVGLALVIAVYRHYRTTNVDKLDELKG
jgi:NADH:ubiquinone oxidoreductase subunit K